MTIFRTRTKILFFVLYLAVCFVLFEGFARLVLRRREAIFAVGSRQGCCVWDLDQNAWRVYWIYRHFYVEHEKFYKYDRFDPTRGWMARPGLRTTFDIPATDRGGRRLTTNSLGFRGKADFPVRKDPARTRIVLLGDSFTFGDEVGDEGTFPYFAQKLLPHAEILNMGVHAYGHDQMLLLWNATGRTFQPDVVVLGFVSQDLLRNQLSFRGFAKPKFELDRGRLVLTHTPVPSPEEVLRNEWWHPKIVDLLSMMAYRIRYLHDPSLPDDLDELSAAILREMASSVRVSGARPLFLYIPEPCHIIGPQADPKILARSQKAFFDFCAQAGVECITAESELRRETATWKEAITTWGHWDARGNAAIARALAGYLVSNKWVGEAPAESVTPVVPPAGRAEHPR